MDAVTENYLNRMQLNSPLLGRVVESIERFSTSDLQQLAGFVTMVVFDRMQVPAERGEG